MRTSKVRRFSGFVTYTDAEGRSREEEFPISSADYEAATRMAMAYVLQVMRLGEFELRVVGA